MRLAGLSELMDSLSELIDVAEASTLRLMPAALPALRMLPHGDET